MPHVILNENTTYRRGVLETTERQLFCSWFEFEKTQQLGKLQFAGQWIPGIVDIAPQLTREDAFSLAREAEEAMTKHLNEVIAKNKAAKEKKAVELLEKQRARWEAERAERLAKEEQKKAAEYAKWVEQFKDRPETLRAKMLELD